MTARSYIWLKNVHKVINSPQDDLLHHINIYEPVHIGTHLKAYYMHEMCAKFYWKMLLLYHLKHLQSSRCRNSFESITYTCQMCSEQSSYYVNIWDYVMLCQWKTLRSYVWCWMTTHAHNIHGRCFCYTILTSTHWKAYNISIRCGKNNLPTMYIFGNM